MYDAPTRRERVETLLEKVGLDASQYNRFPHEFSGGQRQRVNLARAISVDPKFVVCDEPVSGLDVSVQAKVLSIMEELQEELGLTYLFISHDLSVIRYISDRVAVMYLGRIVELGDSERVFTDPKHPYTKGLIGGIPIPDPDASRERETLHGDVPNPSDPPDGCHFHPRCPAFIPPEDVDCEGTEWSDVLAFTRSFERREFPSEEVKTAFDQAFPDGLSDPDVEDLLREVTTLAEEDEWDQAIEKMRRVLIDPSVCTQHVETHEMVDEEDERIVTCHRYADDEIA